MAEARESDDHRPMKTITTYTTAIDMPSLSRELAELRGRVTEILHISIAYGPTPAGAMDPATWYALVVYTTPDD